MLAGPRPRCLDRLSMMQVCRGGALNSRLLFTPQVERRGLWLEKRERGGGLSGNEGGGRRPVVWFNFSYHNTRSIGIALQMSLWDVGQSTRAARRGFPGGGPLVCSGTFWQARKHFCGQKEEVLGHPYKNTKGESVLRWIWVCHTVFIGTSNTYSKTNPGVTLLCVGIWHLYMYLLKFYPPLEMGVE